MNGNPASTFPGAAGRFPVEAKLAEVASALSANRLTVLVAPPGSGKTTRVPLALLNAPWLEGRKIVMLEPRRLAARNSARYMARTLGEKTGGTVGYQVRLEREIGAATRLEVVTEGLLAQRFLADPSLADTGLVVFDEFHERSLACDLALALALDVRRSLRDDLRILVMSATLDGDELARRLEAIVGAPCAVVRAEGRMFPVATEYLGEVSVAAAVGRALKETAGDVLVFLPGEGEIRRALDTLRSTLRDVEVLPLYGALPKEDQDRVFARSPRRKVVLSTSIAETSVTLEGVTAVVDSGLMRVSRFRPATGMPRLVTLPLSLDRAEQRRGRAGRVCAGRCYRLWRETDDASRPQRALPEILDADLAPLALTSAVWGAREREDLPWLTPPPAALWDQARTLLRLLGSLDASGALTDRGRRMAEMAMHPRLANMILGGGDALLAAIIEEGGKSRETDLRMVEVTPRIRELARRFARFRPAASPVLSDGEALALAYPDRIGRGRGDGTFQLVSGHGAFLERGEALAKSPFLVVAELDERAGDAKILRAVPIAEAEIVAHFAAEIRETPYCQWDRAGERVKAGTRLTLGRMTLGERPTAATGEAAVAALIEGVREKGVGNLPGWTAGARRLLSRLKFLHRVIGGDWPEGTDEEILSVLAPFLGGVTRWKDLERVRLEVVLEALVAARGLARRELDRLAPARMTVPSGSEVTIDYGGDEPTAAVKLQECFGLMTTPTVADGRVAVVMTLLSPANRPIQVTKDLAGFWRGAYQLVRKDMRGRYPKHYWPEDPFTAVATRRTVKAAMTRPGK